MKLGYTLKELSDLTGYSISYISQLERGLSEPSLSALRKLAEKLSCSEVWLLMGDESHQHFSTHMQKASNESAEYVVYKENRVPVKIPDNDTDYQIFTPSDLPGNRKASLTGMQVILKPKKWVTEKLIRHQTADEMVLVNKGQLRVVIDRFEYNVQAGDSFYIPKGTLHNYLNIQEDQDAECTVVFTDLIY